MAFIFNGVTIPTNTGIVRFNGIDLDKVVFNGTTVWELQKGPYALFYHGGTFSGNPVLGTPEIRWGQFLKINSDLVHSGYSAQVSNMNGAFDTAAVGWRDAAVIYGGRGVDSFAGLSTFWFTNGTNRISYSGFNLVTNSFIGSLRSKTAGALTSSGSVERAVFRSGSEVEGGTSKNTPIGTSFLLDRDGQQVLLEKTLGNSLDWQACSSLRPTTPGSLQTALFYSGTSHAVAGRYTNAATRITHQLTLISTTLIVATPRNQSAGVSAPASAMFYGGYGGSGALSKVVGIKYDGHTYRNEGTLLATMSMGAVTASKVVGQGLFKTTSVYPNFSQQNMKELLMNSSFSVTAFNETTASETIHWSGVDGAGPSVM